jgi:hypothetical protein
MPDYYYDYYRRARLHYDDREDRLVMLNGNLLRSYSFRNGGEWTSVAPKGEPPPTLWGRTEILDAVSHRLILHGGVDGRAYHGETWQLSLDDPPVWSRVPTGDDDPPEIHGTETYDPKRQRMIVVGPSTEVWSLSLEDSPRWSRLQTEGSFRGRAGYSAIYDEGGDRLVIFGGGGEGADSWYTFNDVWALPLSDRHQWSQLSPNQVGPGAPYPRAFPAALYDPMRHRMIVVGGWVPGAFPRGPFDDAWEFGFDDSKWRQIPADGVIPLWRSPASAYDSRRNRFLFQEYDWLWALQPTRNVPPTGSWVLAVEAVPSERVDPASKTLSLSIVSSNPFAGSFVAEIRLPEDAPATLELFDVGGRRVWAQETTSRQGGRRLVRAAGLSCLRPGVYLLRLTQSHHSRVVRLVHVHSQ